MLVHSAEESFQAGMQCLMAGKNTEALARIEAAIQLELRFGESRPQARYLSYYGLLLALERRLIRDGLRFCREAVTREGYNPDLRCNLGRVLMKAGRRKEAHQAFQRGLMLQGDHPRLRKNIKVLGLRRRPVLPFLGRGNPINVFFGRLRASQRQHATTQRMRTR
jgi:tetratricopeptide (TPR) repeat protein